MPKKCSKSSKCSATGENAMPHAGVEPPKGHGPVRTLKVGDRITVYGDVQVLSVDGHRVTLRVAPASLPPPNATLIPVRRLS